MATLALSVAGQFAGGLVGGPIGATIGRALGALAGSAIDNALFGDDNSSSAPSDMRLLGSSEGGVIPRIYGWNRVAGNIIWATNLERQVVETSGSKGLFNEEDEEIVANFAVALCEGEVAHLGRIWADGRLLETEGLNFRFYKGTNNQSPDTLIEAKQGVGKTPAYRGLCYLVFDGLPLGQFGNRIPNISVELCRVVGELEPAIKAITIIPGATEFGYDPEPRVRIVGFGATRSENAHLLGQTSDWTLSLNELQALCPNLEHVALVVAWFGDDLRCAQCQIQPRVENFTRQIAGTQWVVSGQDRSQVPVMTRYQGGPAYGGTPSDGAVLAAIADLKARGLKVTLYPFVLMDIEKSNSLNDPYTGNNGQPAYPWRGRITCNPAPGDPASPDKSTALKTQTDAFTGSASVSDFQDGNLTVNYTGPTDWGYRRFVLHYAKLATMAGGVNAMLIGSEMRGLTWLRDGDTSFPFVSDLSDLVNDVRTIVGSGTKLSYAADWSEYSGLQPSDAPGDKLFHLDPLWANANIDAIGIDNYMPLSDWRGTGDEPDADIASYAQEISYLSANIAGGEGYDWYYASEADRTAGIRTPITDGTHNEPWVWRYKDLVNWWSNPHHNRVDGVRNSSPTAWVPQSKSLWFTELGCGAVDKGPNSPNLFGDPKSSENATPPFSDGTPDALVQRQYLRAHHRWWQPGTAFFVDANNPTSSQYSGRMVDPDRLFVWTWDARPYPAFPTQTNVWADGKNHETGHWLTGRLGALASDELIAGMAADYDVSFFSLSAASPLVFGAQIANVTTLRTAIEPLLGATGLLLRDTPSGLSAINPNEVTDISVSPDLLAAHERPLIIRQSPNRDETIGQLSLNYIDRPRDYHSASITAAISSNPVHSGIGTNLVLNIPQARQAAETLLDKLQPAATLETALPPSLQAVEIGDRLDIDNQAGGPFRLTQIRGGQSLQIAAQVFHESVSASFAADVRATPSAVPQVASLPEIVVMHLPGDGGDTDGTRLVFGAFADPWPGIVRLKNETTGVDLGSVTARATVGELTQALPPGTGTLWDRKNEILLTLYGGHLTSTTELNALIGANRLGVRNDAGEWEIVGFAGAELLSAGAYRLTNLLRGVQQTQRQAAQTSSSGNRVILLDQSLSSSSVANAQLETTLGLRAFAGGFDATGQSLSQFLSLDIALPLAPANLRADKLAGSDDILLQWKRCTQTGGDSWVGTSVMLDFSPEAYTLSIFDGSNLVRQSTTNLSSWTYSASDQAADFGVAGSNFTFTVQQVSAVLGLGHPATGAFYG
ncbi:MAG TPA: hypothetical protein ENJ90_09295 [Devosia sp.]|nr:hypothetical protein [Devosia sp.]